MATRFMVQIDIDTEGEDTATDEDIAFAIREHLVDVAEGFAIEGSYYYIEDVKVRGEEGSLLAGNEI